MKKVSFVISIITITCILFGCNSLPQNLGDTFILGQDDQFYFVKNPLIQSIAETKDGYYFFSGPDSAFLYYMDKKTMKPVILCNKPDCLHVDETDPFKVPKCNACLYSNNFNLVYYDNYLYSGGHDSIIDTTAYSIYRISLDGAEKKKIFSFKDEVENWIIHRGFIYYSVDDNGTIKGQETSTSSTCKLYRIDLKHIDKGPEIIYENNGIYRRTTKLLGYGNGIYWLTMGYEDADLNKPTYETIKYNITNGKAKILGNDITYLSACNDKLIFRCIDGIMYKSNPDGSGKEKVGDIEGMCLIYTNGSDYIYCDTLPKKQINPTDEKGNKNVRSLLVYDLQGNLVNTIDIDYINKDWCYGGNSDCFFIPDNFSNSNEYGNIRTLWTVNNRKVGSEKSKPQKVFEFVPKVQFPGISTKS